LIEQFEAFYRSFGQTPIFRVAEFASEVSPVLDRRGYSVTAESVTLLALLDGQTDGYGRNVELTTKPSAEWLESHDRLSSTDGTIYRAMLAALRLPAAFAASRVEGRVASIAYAALHDGLVAIESVATDPEYRNRGLGKQTVGALLQWARGQGASSACLQVLADNPPAHAIYHALGFRKELYRYHYRFAPDGP
jgi:N-acetylglutamate synthase